MNTSDETRHQAKCWKALAAVFFGALSVGPVIAAETLPNACPVDGCEVKIIDVEKDGEELALTFEANFSPDLSKNHIHIWWGDKYAVKQVSRNAEATHGVEQGAWHLTDEYPVYVTRGAASTTTRDGSSRLCASAADRDHNILDVTVFHCVDVEEHL